jgi:folliculin
MESALLSMLLYPIIYLQACRPFSQGQPGFVSSDHEARVSYVSTQQPDHPQVFAMIRQACVRSLSCEVQ